MSELSRDIRRMKWQSLRRRAKRWLLGLLLRFRYDGTDRDAAPTIQKLMDASDGLLCLPKGTYTIGSLIVAGQGIAQEAASGERDA